MLLALLGIALSAFTQTPSSDYEQGVALFERGDPAAALPLLDRSAHADASNAQKWKALGAAQAALKHYADAEESFARSCYLDPKLPDACYFHARALYALDRYEDSLRALDHADPRSWRARLARAQTLEALSRSAAAESEYREALSIAGSASPGPAVSFAQFLVRQARAAEALPPLEQTLAVHPASADAHLWLGRALFELNRLPEALPHLERAVTLNPTNPQAHILLAKAYVRANRPADAQPHFALAEKYAVEK